MIAVAIMGYIFEICVLFTVSIQYGFNLKYVALCVGLCTIQLIVNIWSAYDNDRSRRWNHS